MELWAIWYALVNALAACCSRKRTFHWMVVILIGFTIKSDFLGVTSLARGVGLSSTYYTCMLNFFNSSAISLIKLQSLWVELVYQHFSGLVIVNGRKLLVLDGIKVGKEGKKMPGVKWLHQDSESNSKAEHIMGHSLQAVAVLVQGCMNYFAVPLSARIHEGIRYTYSDKRTLLDKAVELLLELELSGSYYLIADKYYCSGPLLKKLVDKGIHMITMMKTNAVAYYPVREASQTRRGRPKKYGEKVKLFDLFDTDLVFIEAPIPNKPSLTLEYCAIELIWRPLGQLVKFVLVKHPIRGNGIVMSTDLSIEPLDMIYGYSLRFKIEVLFKQAIHQLGTFMYRFWLKSMNPKNRQARGDSVLQFDSATFKEQVKRKINAYHLFIQLGLIAQGLLQFLSIYHHEKVWENFGSWLRTIRDKTLPSEMVVSMAMRNSYPKFLNDESKGIIFKKFLRERLESNHLYSGNYTEKISA